MLQQKIEIINKLGLHARAAAKLVTLASSFACDIKLEFNNKQVNGKSIMGVMMLAAARGSEITLVTDGSDEELAMQKLTELINGKFGEET